MTSGQVVAMYIEKRDKIRFFSMMNLCSAGWSCMWVAAISAQLRRIESGRSPLWTYLQLSAGICSSFLFCVQALTWTVASFRPERHPEITQAFNNMAFLWFLMPFVFATVGCLAIGCAILEDKSRVPVFPRWVGYANLWFAIGFPMAMFTTYAKTGPFAWDGLFPWWIPVIDYTIWSVVMSWATARASNRQYDEEGEAMAIDMAYALREIPGSNDTSGQNAPAEAAAAQS
jgi:magnesium-transporting ATPase (P-type)